MVCILIDIVKELMKMKRKDCFIRLYICVVIVEIIKLDIIIKYFDLNDLKFIYYYGLKMFMIFF